MERSERHYLAAFRGVVWVAFNCSLTCEQLREHRTPHHTTPSAQSV